MKIEEFCKGKSLMSYNGHSVYKIDGILTVIYSIHNNIAKGAIIEKNGNFSDCYIAKIENYYAHGKTIHEAYNDALDKAFLNYPIEERIRRIVNKYPNLDKQINNSELFDIHYKLTGSCRLGREFFCKEYNINPKEGTMSMREFISLTKNAYYGGNIIKELAKAYKIDIK